MSSAGSKPVLGYWAVRARAQHIRTFLAFVGQEYEYKEYQVSNAVEWFAKDKPALDHPLANLPYWKDGDLTLMQGNAIMRHLARQHGLAGKNENQLATADMLAEYFADIRHTHIQLCFGPDKNKFGEKKAAYDKDWQENQLPKIGKLLAKKEFLLGSEISYIDFILYELLHVHGLFMPEMDLKKEAPIVADFLLRFEALPAIAEFHKKEAKLGVSRTVYAAFATWPGNPAPSTGKK